MGSRFTVKQSMRVRPWLGLQNFHWYTFPLIYSFLLAHKQLRVQRLVQHPAKFSYLTRFTLSNSNPLKTKSGWGNQISKWYQGHCIIKGVLIDVHLMISCYLGWMRSNGDISEVRNLVHHSNQLDEHSAICVFNNVFASVKFVASCTWVESSKWLIFESFLYFKKIWPRFEPDLYEIISN